MNLGDLKTTVASRCGKCGHCYLENGGDPYTCPACNSGVPYTHTIYPFVDKFGQIVHQSNYPRLRDLGVIRDGGCTRDEFLDGECVFDFMREDKPS